MSKNSARHTQSKNKLKKHDFITNLHKLIAKQIVYRTNDQWGDIFVIEKQHYRELRFESPNEQSKMDIRNPSFLVHKYTRAMIIVLAFIKPKHVTILGLGGGCILRCLFYLIPVCKFHVVELRQCVYNIASEFFGLPSSENITITINDAKKHMKNALDKSTNIIFSDIYGSEGMNPFQQDNRFLNKAYRILTFDGWLVINYLEILDFDIPFFRHMCNLFLSVFVCKIPGGNTIIFACKSRINELNQFDSTITELEKKIGLGLKSKFKRMNRLMLCEGNTMQKKKNVTQ